MLKKYINNNINHKYWEKITETVLRGYITGYNLIRSGLLALKHYHYY